MRRPDLIQLRAIAAIRDVQAAAARSEAARAATVLAEKGNVLSDAERLRETTVANWQTALSAPSLAVETLPLWTSAVMRRDGQVRTAERDVDAARAVLDERARDFHAATKRSDIARDMVRRTARQRAAECDEAALSVAADLHLQRRRAE
jgi:type II secretory pathway component PulL